MTSFTRYAPEILLFTYKLYSFVKAALIAARNLRSKLDEVERAMEKPLTWGELIKVAYSKDVDLTSRYA